MTVGPAPARVPGTMTLCDEYLSWVHSFRVRQMALVDSLPASATPDLMAMSDIAMSFLPDHLLLRSSPDDRQAFDSCVAGQVRLREALGRALGRALPEVGLPPSFRPTGAP